MTIPGASSWDVLEEVKKTWQDIKVVLTSAYSLEMVVRLLRNVLVTNNAVD